VKDNAATANSQLNQRVLEANWLGTLVATTTKNDKTDKWHQLKPAKLMLAIRTLATAASPALPYLKAPGKRIQGRAENGAKAEECDQ